MARRFAAWVTPGMVRGTSERWCLVAFGAPELAGFSSVFGEPLMAVLLLLVVDVVVVRNWLSR